MIQTNSSVFMRAQPCISTTERVTKLCVPLLFTGFSLSSTEVGSSWGEGGAWYVGGAGGAEDTQLKSHDACDESISPVLA